MFVDDYGYTFTLHGQKSWWGATGSGGRTVKCAATRTELDYDHGNITYQMFSLAAAGVMNTVSVFFMAGRGKMDPDKSVVFAYDGVPAI